MSANRYDTHVVWNGKRTCEAYPTQYEGTLGDGRMWHFRARGGIWTFSVSDEATEDIRDAICGRDSTAIELAAGADPSNGCMHSGDAEALIGGLILTIPEVEPQKIESVAIEVKGGTLQNLEVRHGRAGTAVDPGGYMAGNLRKYIDSLPAAGVKAARDAPFVTFDPVQVEINHRSLDCRCHAEPVVPCPDCTATPGWYVGFSARRPCPTCCGGGE